MGERDCLLFSEICEVLKKTVWVLKDRLTQSLKALNKPILNVGFYGIYLNREIKIVRHEVVRCRANLQHI